MQCASTMQMVEHGTLDEVKMMNDDPTALGLSTKIQ